MTAPSGTGEGGLRALAQHLGVATELVDGLGVHRRPPPEVLLAVLRALGAPVHDDRDAGDALIAVRRAQAQRVLPAATVVTAGAPAPVRLLLDGLAPDRAAVRITLDTGEVREGTTGLDRVVDRFEVGGAHFATHEIETEPLPVGYHELCVTVGGAEHRSRILSAPRRVHRVDDRRCGAFAPLYALRAEGAVGMADFGHLGDLAEGLAPAGARVLGTLPLHAAFLEQPFEPSPYGPVSRLFWNELYLDLAALPELAGDRVVLDDARRRGAELADARLADFGAAWALRKPLLSTAAERFFAAGASGLDAFLSSHPRADDYARFRAVAARQPDGFRSWPERVAAGLIEEGDYDDAERRLHLYAQLRCAEQMQALADRCEAAGVALYLDMPLGVHPDGYDAWRERDRFLEGCSAGAPPDGLFTGGQNWGFRPLHPAGAFGDGGRYFAECLRADMRPAGVLRIDHVMGMHRIYVIPHGVAATDGTYVRMPADEAYATVAIESVRNGAEVVGEDLGTVPDEVRGAMHDASLLRMYVFPFELHRRPLGSGAGSCVASFGTHDLPTFAGWAAGDDVDVRVELGLVDETQAETLHEERRATLRWLADQLGCPAPGDADGTAAIRDAIHQLLANGDASIVLVTLEDLWLEREPQNVPGTHLERPNFRRRMARTLREILDDSAIAGALSALAGARAASSP